MPEPLPLRSWRRRLRISVRGLIVLVLITGVGLGWLVNGARIQREAVAALRRDGGVVLYDWERDGQWRPKWLVDHLGADYLGHAASVSLSHPGSPSALRHIGRFSHIRLLEVYGPFVTDAGLAHLAGLTNLRYLDIGDRHPDCLGGFTFRGAARVTDAGMPYLKGLTKLIFLDLNGTQVGDAGLAHLAGLTGLESLRLQGTRVTDAGLVHLAAMTKLRDLQLDETAVTDAGLVHLKTLIGLRFLSLRGTQITDAGLAHLEHLAKLGELDLRGTRITDAGLAHLEHFTELGELDLLRDTRITVEQVGRMPAWGSIERRGTRASPAAKD